KKFSALDVDHRFLRVRARDGEERNHHNGSQTLRDDALCCLQVHVCLRQVFGDHRRLLFKGKLDGSLAGCHAFRWYAQCAIAPREFYFQRFRRVLFEQQAAIRIGHGDGVIQHVAQRFVEGKLRMQQGTGFEQALELNQPPPDGSELVMCSIRVSSWGRESLSVPLAERKIISYESSRPKVMESPS